MAQDIQLRSMRKFPVWLCIYCLYICRLTMLSTVFSTEPKSEGGALNLITRCVPGQPTRTSRQFCIMPLGGAAMLWKWGGQRHVWPLHWSARWKCCSRRLQVRVAQNCRTEVLEHRQDQVLSKPRWDMSFREFYVIVALIPTGVVLLSLRGRW